MSDMQTFLDRREGERRKRHMEALRFHFERCDGCISDPRSPAQQAADSAFIADWSARFTDLRASARA